MPEEDLRQFRLAKIERLREAGLHPWPERFERTHALAEAMGLAEGTDGVKLAGRLVSMNKMGKLVFAWLADLEGRLQIAIRKDQVGEAAFELFTKNVDLGDFVGVEGSLIRTRTGELTLQARSWTFLGKALRPLPEKWHGLADPEACYRERHLDLVSSDETRRRFLLRIQAVRKLREFLDRHGFLEVDTPVLVDKPSGALARPFVSHHHTLDMQVTLRIAPETYLKRCVAGGFDRVYEFARCFRNEGMDASHLQDFTMLEFYAAYWSYEDNMAFTRAMLQEVVGQLLGKLRLEREGREISFEGEWPRRPLAEVIESVTGIDVLRFEEAGRLREEIARRGLAVEDREMAPLGLGGLIDLLYKRTCRATLQGPLFLVGHPIALSPLARRSDRDPRLADRFQLVVAGWEVVNAYSELVDPVDQRARLEEQAKSRAAGDAEAMVLDEDYLRAMESGLPPISGWGMGIERFVALLAGVPNLRDVVLFPLMRPAPEQPESDTEEEKHEDA